MAALLSGDEGKAVVVIGDDAEAAALQPTRAGRGRAAWAALPRVWQVAARASS